MAFFSVIDFYEGPLYTGPMAYYINENCTACAVCLLVCPTGSIMENTPQFLIDADSCLDSGLCVAVCPEKAIQKL